MLTVSSRRPEGAGNTIQGPTGHRPWYPDPNAHDAHEQTAGDRIRKTESTRTATIGAVEKCFVRVVTKEDFLKLIKCNPQLVLAISKTLAHRIVQLNEKIIGKII